MIAIAKLKLGLNLLLIAPLITGIAIVTSLSTVQSQTLPDHNVGGASSAEITQFSINPQPIPATVSLEANPQETIDPVTANTPSNSNPVATNSENLAKTQSAPFPGNSTTDAAVLTTPVASPVTESASTNLEEVAQLPLDPGRSTRGGSSYVGVAGNIGLSGDTALGDGNFAIISKIGLTRSLAVRPGVVLGNDATFLIPLTYEFSIRQAEALEEVLPIAPYIGAGVTIYTGDDDDDSNDSDGGVGLLLTGGVDIPINRQFTANAGVNVGIGDETDIGLSVGVGYNFSGLGL